LAEIGVRSSVLSAITAVVIGLHSVYY